MTLVMNSRKTSAIEISGGLQDMVVQIDVEQSKALSGETVQARMFFSIEEAKQIRAALDAALEGK